MCSEILCDALTIKAATAGFAPKNKGSNTAGPN